VYKYLLALIGALGASTQINPISSNLKLDTQKNLTSLVRQETQFIQAIGYNFEFSKHQMLPDGTEKLIDLKSGALIYDYQSGKFRLDLANKMDTPYAMAGKTCTYMWDGDRYIEWLHSSETTPLSKLAPQKPGSAFIYAQARHAFDQEMYDRLLGITTFNIPFAKLYTVFENPRLTSLSEVKKDNQEAFLLEAPSCKLWVNKETGLPFSTELYKHDDDKELFETWSASNWSTASDFPIATKLQLITNETDEMGGLRKMHREATIDPTSIKLYTSADVDRMHLKLPSGTEVFDKITGASYYVNDRPLNGNELLPVEERLKEILDQTTGK
jgi:hypothetical protein